MRTLHATYGVRLTAREVVILEFVQSGYTSSQIAAQLNISENTVFNHRKNILKKKGLTRLPPNTQKS